jgi:uncharacterized protein YsxB (DUF464 family)
MMTKYNVYRVCAAVSAVLTVAVAAGAGSKF